MLQAVINYTMLEYKKISSEAFRRLVPLVSIVISWCIVLADPCHGALGHEFKLFIQIIY